MQNRSIHWQFDCVKKTYCNNEHFSSLKPNSNEHVWNITDDDDEGHSNELQPSGRNIWLVSACKQLWELSKESKPPQVVNLYVSERLTHSRCFSCWISLTHSLPSSSSNLPLMFHLCSWWYIAHDLQKYIYLQHFGTRPSAGKIVSLLATFFFFTRPSPDSRNKCESSHVKASSVQVAACCL